MRELLELSWMVRDLSLLVSMDASMSDWKKREVRKVEDQVREIIDRLEEKFPDETLPE